MNKRKLMENFLEKNPDAQITFVSHKWYQMEIKKGEKLYLCRFYKVPSGTKLTVNNEAIWQILNGKPGIKMMGGVSKLIQGKDSRKHTKLAIMVNNISPIRKWINECEMEFVNSYTDIYGAKMVEVEKIGDQITAL